MTMTKLCSCGEVLPNNTWISNCTSVYITWRVLSKIYLHYNHCMIHTWGLFPKIDVSVGSKMNSSVDSMGSDSSQNLALVAQWLCIHIFPFHHLPIISQHWMQTFCSSASRSCSKLPWYHHSNIWNVLYMKLCLVRASQFIAFCLMLLDLKWAWLMM